MVMELETSLKGGMDFGKWVLVGKKQLGAGGNGIVWATDPAEGKADNAEGKHGAIKFFNREKLERRWENKAEVDIREKRFRIEIEFQRKEGQRPGILPLWDFSPPEADLIWFVMPLAKPFTELNLSGPERFEELVRKIESIAHTLAALHDEKKFHRDLHPGNLFLLNGEPVVGDFGLVDFPGKERVTRDEDRIGARDFLPPEMKRNAANAEGGPADVFMFAKTFWVLASGQPPEDGPLRIDIPQLQFSNVCRHPRAGRFDVLLDQATDHDPTRRPSMREFCTELTAWLNPPSTVAANTDLNFVAKEYQNVFEIENRAKRNREELIHFAKAALATFDGVLNQIAKQISQCVHVEAHVGYPSSLEDHRFIETYGGVGLVSREAKGVRVEIGEAWKCFLQSFVQVEALTDDTIRIVAGHLAETTVQGERFYGVPPAWKQEIVAPRGSARLENGMEILRSGLLENLSAAVDAFGKCVKQLRK